MSAFIPDAIPSVLMSAAGIVLALWGRRMAGRLRWYHLGWLPVLVGLLGTGFTLPQPFHHLTYGLVWSISYALLLISPENTAEFLLSGLWDDLKCLLVTVLGLAILILGQRRGRNRPSAKIE